MLEPGSAAPDFTVRDSSLHQMLEDRAVVVFFFFKTFGVG